MKGFLEQRRDWQIEQVMEDQKNGIISKYEAMERTQLIEERYDKARRWRDNVA